MRAYGKNFIRTFLAMSALLGACSAQSDSDVNARLPPLSQDVRPVAGGWFKESSNLGNINFDISDNGVVAGNWSTYKDGKPVWYYFQGQIRYPSFGDSVANGVVAVAEASVADIASGSPCLTCDYAPPLFNANGTLRIEFTSPRTARFIRNNETPIEISAWMQGTPLFAQRKYTRDWVMAVRQTSLGDGTTPPTTIATVATGFLIGIRASAPSGLPPGVMAYAFMCSHPQEACAIIEKDVLGHQEYCADCVEPRVYESVLYLNADDSGALVNVAGSSETAPVLVNNGRKWTAYGDRNRILIRSYGDVDPRSELPSDPRTMEIAMYPLPPGPFMLADSFWGCPGIPTPDDDYCLYDVERASPFKFSYALRPATGGWFQPNSNLGNINFDISDNGIAAGNWSTFRDGKPIWYYFQGTMRQTDDEEAQRTGIIAVAESPLYETSTGGRCPTCPYVPPQFGEPAHQMRIEFTSSRTARFIHDDTLTLPLTAWMQGAPLFAPRDYSGDWLAIARYSAERTGLPSLKHHEAFAQYRLEAVDGPEIYRSDTLSAETLARVAPPMGARRYQLVCKSPNATCDAMKTLSSLESGADDDFSLLWLGANELGTTVRAKTDAGQGFVLSSNAFDVYGERDRIILRRIERRTTVPANPYQGVTEIVFQRLPTGVFDGASWTGELYKSYP